MLDFDTARGPLLVFGGPYSNLEAARALQTEAQRLGIEPRHVICTGDVVAYCADPEATAQFIRDWGIHVVAGNCEEQLAIGSDDCSCGFEAGSACDTLAKGWYPFANARVSPESRVWMSQLAKHFDFRFAGISFRVIHGGVTQTNKFVFGSETQSLQSELQCCGADVVIAGHCGLPFISKHGDRIWFNPGVIGMPANDASPSVWYGLITVEPGGIKLETRRLAYDHHSAAASLRRAGHANDYARTLVTGLWPNLDILPPPERAAAGSRIKPRSLLLKTKALATA